LESHHPIQRARKSSKFDRLKKRWKALKLFEKPLSSTTEIVGWVLLKGLTLSAGNT